MNPTPQQPSEEPYTPAPGTTPAAESAPAADTPEIIPLTPVPPNTSSPLKNKKLLIIVGSIVAAVLIALISVGLFTSATTVSKSDYQAASAQFAKVTKASTQLTADIYLLSASTSIEDSAFDENAKKVVDSLTAIKTENAALGKLKAVRVGEGKKLYETFNSKTKDYLANGSDLLISVKTLRPAVIVCNKVASASDSASRLQSLKDCSTAMNKVKDLPSPEFQTFVTVLKKQYADYATTYEQVSTLNDPLGAQYEQYKVLRDKLTKVQTTLTTANKTFIDDLAKRDDELSVKDSSKALSDFLTEQVKG